MPAGAEPAAKDAAAVGLAVLGNEYSEVIDGPHSIAHEPYVAVAVMFCPAKPLMVTDVAATPDPPTEVELLPM